MCGEGDIVLINDLAIGGFRAIGGREKEMVDFGGE